MDTAFEMTDDQRRRVRSFAKTETRGRADAHIDDLMPGVAPEHWVEATLQTLLEVCGEIRDRSKLIICCFPLSASPSLSTEVADWSEVLDNSADEPPSLYILPLSAQGEPEAVEEYRCPVSIPWDCPAEYKLVAYYRCFRNLLGIANQWEYERACYLELMLSDGSA
jgi:hypothetical protein